MTDKMRMFMFEGTAEQIAQVATSMGASAAALVAADPDAGVVAPTVADDDGEKKFVTTEFAREVLSRRSLSKEQKGVLTMLAKAYPNDVLATDLQSALNYSSAQFAGLMGAYGRRISHTANYDDQAWFFDSSWDYDRGCYRYKLPASVLEAIRAEGIA